MHHLKEVQRCGQSIWIDFLSRELISSGKLERLVEDGIRGVTSNPTIFQKSIAECDEYDDQLRAILKSDPRTDVQAIFEQLAIRDIEMAADILRPVYDSSDRMDGMVSLEVNPGLAYDTGGTIAEARRLWRAVNRPNLMIKVPGTGPGIPAVEALTAEGININITLMFSMNHYNAVSRAYIQGISRCPDPSRVTSVASFFVSRVDTYVDRELQKIGTPEALALRGKAAVANAKLVYRRFREVFYGPDFAAGRSRGARIQRPLWGSTSTKNPAYPDVLYVDNLIGPDTINTVPPETLEAFLDHGKIHATIQEGLAEAGRALAGLKGLGIDLDNITEQLQKDGVKAFADSLGLLFKSLEKKGARLLI